MPKGGLIGTGFSGPVGSEERAYARDTLRRAWYFPKGESRTTPFRQVMSAGDQRGHTSGPVDAGVRQTNQVSGVGMKLNIPPGTKGGIPSRGGGALYTGNPSFVYDSSDYARYRKLRAINRNYNDCSYGGDENHASQTALSRVRSG